MQSQVRNTSETALISFEVALQVVNTAIMSEESRHLKNIEIEVLRGVLQGQKYDEIAAICGYAPEYIKNDVGPKLWQSLSSIWGKKVSKNNLMAVLAQQVFQEKLQNKPSTKSESLLKAIPCQSNFYIERPLVESRCYAEIIKPGALIQIKAPQQMGKTSLMLKILDYARKNSSTADNQEVRTVALSLKRADKATFNDLDKFLRWLCYSITRKLQLPNRIEEYWNENFGSKNNCTAYFEEYLLPAINGTLVLGFDNVDVVHLYPEIAEDFFSLLDSWCEEVNYGDSGNPIWQNLRFILVDTEEVYNSLNTHESFNAGLTIKLQPFTSEQVQCLAQCYKLQLSQDETRELMQFVGGHPYLVKQTFEHLTQQKLTLSELLQVAATDTDIYGHHLQRYLRSLQQHPKLAAAYHQVVKASSPIELEKSLAFKLCNMGLATLQGNKIVPSCELYRKFIPYWFQTNEASQDKVYMSKNLYLVS
ncbi:hypothetical protein DSM106972_091630 [Dulcicalothrix desertica PCC 7102]|uniref:vWA-MoxR associated protein N-terminal HTH domain-containing protein n=1 Tax=Dulcicalothrix desertica PCC 7102 TaxID=232991 RepID=A0A3S5K303_9CYAN|nr:AAA-like domain-containing protein [Dulcicalothrix desertica]RUS95003.1 hypothetical protein DSM106972_091630 [Dulcicalothrix desertica PCC 7102]TWH51419.1 AAA domain-containing protein [Dulcicalothrix desertica PCC 7102]